MGRESIEQLNKVKFFSAGSAEDRAADLETIAGNLETISNRIKNLIGDLGLEGETGTAADEALGNASTAAVHGSEFVKVIAEARRLAATAGRNAVQVQEEVEKSVGDADSTFSNATPATEKGGDTLSASSVSAYDKAVKAHDAAVEAARVRATPTEESLRRTLLRSGSRLRLSARRWGCRAIPLRECTLSR